MKKIAALLLIAFTTSAFAVDIADVEVGVKLDSVNPLPLPINTVTGTSTSAQDYNLIQPDVRNTIKSTSDNIKAQVKADRGSRDAIAVGSTGSTVGNKSATMSTAYNSFITGATCGAAQVLEMENYFTGSGATCRNLMPGDPGYCAMCTTACVGTYWTTECTTCSTSCYTDPYGGYGYYYGGG